jgi:hypothetical protein
MRALTRIAPVLEERTANRFSAFAGAIWCQRRFEIVSTKNIVAIVPVLEGFSIFEVPVPTAVAVTFHCHGGDRTYRYTAVEAIAGILAGEDPSQWGGQRIE